MRKNKEIDDIRIHAKKNITLNTVKVAWLYVHSRDKYAKLKKIITIMNIIRYKIKFLIFPIRMPDIIIAKAMNISNISIVCMNSKPR
jgi:hypothetical protein